MIKPTDDNLRSCAATEPLTRWLISAANDRRTLTYGEAKDRLEIECGFGSIGRASRIGPIAEAAQENIRKQNLSVPVLNVLLVRKDTRKPGSGAQIQLSKHFPNRRWLKKKDAHKNHLWERVVNEATKEVYAYSPLGTPLSKMSTEELIRTLTLFYCLKSAEKRRVAAMGAGVKAKTTKLCDYG